MVGLQTYTHSQTTPAITWTVNHGFGRRPTCDVFIDYNGGIQKVIPLSVQAITENQLVIKFSSAQSGIARLV